MRVHAIALGLCLLFSSAVAAQPDPDHILSIEGSPGLAHGQTTVNVVLDLLNAPRPIEGWSWGICDAENAHVATQQVSGDAALLNGGDGPELEIPVEYPGEGWTVLVIVSFMGSDFLAPGGTYVLHEASYDLGAEGMASLSFCQALGDPRVATTIVDDQNPSTAIVPTQLPGEIVIEPSRPGILRGDCDHSGQFSGVPDGLFSLNFQFIPGSPAPPCLAECDANGDGVFNALVDALHIFNFAFVPGSDPIPAPFFGCDAEEGTGFDSIGALGCEDPACVFPL